MPIQNITFVDKSTGDTMLAADVNEIKDTVNNNAEELFLTNTIIDELSAVVDYNSGYISEIENIQLDVDALSGAIDLNMQDLTLDVDALSGAIDDNTNVITSNTSTIDVLQADLNEMSVEFATVSLTASNIHYPQIDGSQGDVIVTNGSGELSFGSPERIEIRIANNSGGVIPMGTPIHSIGEKGNSGILRVDPSRADDISKLPAIGITTTELQIDEEGTAVITGIFNPPGGITVTGATEGDTLYVGPAGGLTTTKPTGDNKIQNMGQVVRVNNVGDVRGIKISSIDRTNDVPNLNSGEIFYGDGTNNYTISAFTDVLEQSDLHTVVTSNSSNWEPVDSTMHSIAVNMILN